jgi:hypothetical protein
VVDGRLTKYARLTVAVWKWVWYDPPPYCLRHWIEIALKQYGYHDYGDWQCPRCNPPPNHADEGDNVVTVLSEEDMAKILAKARNIVDCGCCPINEQALTNTIDYIVDGLGYTVTEILDAGLTEVDTLGNEIAAVYYYDVYMTNAQHTVCDNATA